MTQEERLEKICRDFSSLNEKQQDYILGILQALVFAKSENGQSANGQTAYNLANPENSWAANNTK